MLQGSEKHVAGLIQLEEAPRPFGGFAAAQRASCSPHWQRRGGCERRLCSTWLTCGPAGSYGAASHYTEAEIWHPLTLSSDHPAMALFSLIPRLSLRSHDEVYIP